MVVQIHTASEAELRAIPGVGQKTAKVIVRLREKHGTMTPELLSLALGRTVPRHVLELVEFPEAEQDFSLVVSDDLSEQFAEVEQFYSLTTSRRTGPVPRYSQAGCCSKA
ncbi:hypothetical protein DPMN_165174 [Dreissena polymorpha]|uniref:Uncharacterized protein n=1 Tax=Dreissena polymorpha TaxID=45954 RepID=A0A9D4IUD3_DREPO|nr:hypothetical protein DPMN_165174 [Dreissena polymorpha]